MANKSMAERGVDLARHGKAIYDIIKAASAGGFAGAAVAVVKHYWPQILAICAALLLLPILIFLCLPAMIFEYGNISDITPAEAIDMAYSGYSGDLDAYIQEISDKFLDGNMDNLLSYSEDNVVVGSRSVKYNGGAMDVYWFAAIHSVYHGNDNKNMNETEMREFVGNLTETSLTDTIIERMFEEGEEPITLVERTLHVSYLDPYDLMNRLNFSENQVEWAELLYSTMLNTEVVAFVGSSGFSSPVTYNWRNYVNSEFGYRTDPIVGGADNHTGIDIGLPYGTNISAVKDGTVVAVVHGYGGGYGNHVKISHDNPENPGMILETMYCHCSELLVKVGDKVKKGDVIAKVGSTGKSSGPHLHFEVRINGKAVNPRPYLP